ncbi:CRISPR-associated endonuclease Cas2 [Arcicella sp. LKC2W]|uniref:CRISPR-associated endoribonuclease Cas2 n=1 Tax=Arcicella aurantiaca TaxID=591202 RepID=A0A316DHR1_9BACT|nr:MULTISPECIES: CRISPR-associated endonuclease Cas2 [Arcicella]MEA5462070.1 CRISPR-associated endonuclease Cas2 [Arcicella sp. LKC2W]PWK16769.1 CRISPR-associated protein Cas2 [Arcicella aurantiaca]
MVIWVLYDIENDKNRTKVSKICKQAGLYRVQFSCFVGTLTNNEKDTLTLRLEELINVDVDKIYIFPMNQTELKQTVLLGQAFDKKLVNDEIRALFF